MKKIPGLIFLFLLMNFSIIGQIMNKKFKSEVQTIILSKSEEKTIITDNPVIDLGTQGNYQICFDDLVMKNLTYHLRVIHCQSDWKPSNLSEIEYLQDFNDIPIRSPKNSFGTKIPYLHYQIELPKVRISGNYIAMVYAQRNKRDTVFTKRFSVYENAITVAAKISFARPNHLRNTHQAIDLTLIYPNQLMLNSDEGIQVILRKNYQTKNWLDKIPRAQINGQDRKITFPFYDNENVIPGGNEFRLINLSSTQQKMTFVESIRQYDAYTEVSTQLEVPQGNYSYVQRPDFDGSFVIDHYENGNSNVSSDYIWCIFQLKMEELANEQIYVVGAFNQFEKSLDNLMEYDASKQMYTKRIRLKQGIYNYQFVSNKPNNMLEGNYSQTENTYEVLVYFRKPGDRHDSLLGYNKLLFP
ncbi:type IX secretion system plug protein domain-containing protein [Aquirufa ecclesiirivi]